MKKIVSIISIFAMMMSSCVHSLCLLMIQLKTNNYRRSDFAYEKGTNNILAYVGTSDICEIPENSTLLGLTHVMGKHIRQL